MHFQAKTKFTESVLSLLPCLAWLLPLIVCEPLSSALALISASLLHESGHIFAFFITSSPRPKLEGAPFGFILMPSRPLSYKSELIIAFFGPLFNLLFATALFLMALPSPNDAEYYFILLNIMTALYNLLPLYFLDGGRILFSLCALIFPLSVSEKIRDCVSFFFLLSTLFLSLWLIMIRGVGYTLFLAAGLFMLFSSKNHR